MSRRSTVKGINRLNAFEGNHAPVTRRLSKQRTTIARVEQRRRSFCVDWADGHQSQFHYIWLRHNCFCAHCGSSTDGIRSLTIPAIPRDVRPSSHSLDEVGNLSVTWSDDDHHSSYGTEWLRTYCYSNAERERRLSFRPQLWKAELAEQFPTLSYAQIEVHDEARLNLYELLRDYGIVEITGVGTDPGETERVANLLGPIHPTSVYGTIFDLRSERVARAAGKTVIHQEPHTDDAFYYSAPGVAVFHFLANTRGGGGESVYVDGFAVAESLRLEQRRAFELLSTVPIQHHRRHHGEIDMRSHAPLIQLDRHGRLSGVRYFDRATAPLDVPAETMEAMYEALRQYALRMTSAEFKVERLVAAGCAMFVDNHRVMHARNAFPADSDRHLRLCVVDREEFHARLRILGSQFERDSYDWVLPAGSTAT